MYRKSEQAPIRTVRVVRTTLGLSQDHTEHSGGYTVSALDRDKQRDHSPDRVVDPRDRREAISDAIALQTSPATSLPVWRQTLGEFHQTSAPDMSSLR